MQTGKKSVNSANIAKVAEIISLLEEAQKNKDWIFQQIKRKHLQSSKNSSGQ